MQAPHPPAQELYRFTKRCFCLIALLGSSSAFARSQENPNAQSQSSAGHLFPSNAGLKNQAEGKSSSKSSSSTEGIAPYLEYKKRVETAQNVSALDNGVFGESISLFNGSTRFSVVDIDLPGNTALPVQLSRVFDVAIQPQSVGPAYDNSLRGIGNWAFDIPYMSATYPTSTGWYVSRCSGGMTPPFSLEFGAFSRQDYWSGVSVNVPGRGATALLLVDSGAPKPSSASVRFTTTERDFFDCIPTKSGLPGEGFRMTTATGLKYYFDVGAVRTASTLQGQVLGSSGESEPRQVYLPRNMYYLLASKIEDPLGNSVNFEYTTAGHPTRVWSSDGREIVLRYSNGRLATAAADGRIWSYEYTSNQYGDVNLDLARVVLPDSSRWTYAYSGNLKPSAPPAHETLLSAWCHGEPAQIEQAFTLTATHPSGAMGTFDFENTRQYRSGVHATECVRVGPVQYENFSLSVPYFFDVMSVTRKSISGPGVPAKVWSYDYGMQYEFLWGTPQQAPVYPCTTCRVEKQVNVTNPDGTKIRHRYGIMYRFNEGRMLGVDTLDAAGTAVRSDTHVYLSETDAPSQQFHGAYGSALGNHSDPMSTLVRPVISRTTIQQARKFVWQVDRSCGPSGNAYCFDYLARPAKVIRSSAPSP